MPSLKLMLTMDIMVCWIWVCRSSLQLRIQSLQAIRIRIQIWSLLGLETRQTKGTILDWLNFPVSWHFLAKIGMGISNKTDKQNNIFLFMK